MKSKINLFNQDLQPPETTLQEVLYEMITRGGASIVQFSWLCGFRTRISELKNKYNLPFENVPKIGKNKWGREYDYTVHVLKNENIELAKSIYNEMQKNSKPTNFKKK